MLDLIDFIEKNIIAACLILLAPVLSYVLIKEFKLRNSHIKLRTIAKNAGEISPHYENPSKPRQADVLKLSRADEARRKKAMHAIEKGEIYSGIKELINLGLQRDAISILEKMELIEEACELLMDMNRPNRAGAVCQRNGRPLAAAQFYIRAGMKVEAAECFLEAAKTDANFFVDAAKLQAEIKNFPAALEILLQQKQYPLFAKIIKEEKLFLLMRNILAEQHSISEIFDEFDFKTKNKIIAALPTDLTTARSLAVWCQEIKRIEFIELCLRKIENEREMAKEFWEKLNSEFRATLVSAMTQAPSFSDEKGHRFLSKHAHALLSLQQYSLASKLYVSALRISMGAKCLILNADISGAIDLLTRFSGDSVLLKQLEALDLTPEKKATKVGEVQGQAERIFSEVNPEGDDLHGLSPFSLSA